MSDENPYVQIIVVVGEEERLLITLKEEDVKRFLRSLFRDELRKKVWDIITGFDSDTC